MCILGFFGTPSSAGGAGGHSYILRVGFAEEKCSLSVKQSAVFFSLCTCLFARMYACMHACVCVCVCKRQTERDSERETETKIYTHYMIFRYGLDSARQADPKRTFSHPSACRHI